METYQQTEKQEFVRYVEKKILEKARAQLKNRLSCFTILLVVYRYILGQPSSRNAKADLYANTVFLISVTST